MFLLRVRNMLWYLHVKKRILTDFVNLVPVVREPVQKHHECVHRGRPGGRYLHHKPQCPGEKHFIIIQWGSEIWTCTDFESKSGLVMEWSWF